MAINQLEERGVSTERQTAFKILLARYMNYIAKLSNDDLTKIINHPDAIKYYESL